MTDTQPTFDGMEAPDVRITLLGARLDLSDEAFALGESVAFTVKGHVSFTGAELLAESASRRVVKVRCDIIELDS